MSMTKKRVLKVKWKWKEFILQKKNFIHEKSP